MHRSGPGLGLRLVRRAWWTAGVLTLAGAVAAWAGAGAGPGVETPWSGHGVQPEEEEERPEVVVVLKDGRRLSGFLKERTEQRVVLEVAGIDTVHDVGDVERVEVLPSVTERYLELKAALAGASTEARLRLVDWLVERRRFGLALAEVEEAIAADPQNPMAQRKRVEVQMRAELAQRRVEPGEAATTRTGVAPSDIPLLTPEQVNLIKVYEVDLRAGPRLRISRETIDLLMSRHAQNPLIPSTREGREAMYRMPPTELLDLMFQLQARDLYGHVEVVGDPPSMEQFRANVNATWLANVCATTRCHGGEEAGRLRLTSRRPRSEQEAYTNFLILERFRLPDGSPLIRYDDPGRSPLLHLGLPRRDSLFPHPVVAHPNGRGDAWVPAFRQGLDDRRYQQAVTWIRSMYQPRPDYPVEYEPPMGRHGPGPDR